MDGPRSGSGRLGLGKYLHGIQYHGTKKLLTVGTPPKRKGRAMRVLVACEFSGIVRDAFLSRGHDAWSCDLLPSEKEGPHICGPVELVLDQGWDLMIAHPPCTALTVSGAWYYKDKPALQDAALAFVSLLLHAPIPRIALENPVGIISTRIRKPDQIIQPYQFG